MGFFLKVRCPVCGWQVSPGAWAKSRADMREVGLLFHSTGNKGIEAVRRLYDWDELEEHLRPEDPDIFDIISERALAMLEAWCKFGWLDRGEVLRHFGLYPLGGGIWAEEFERVSKGKRPISRVVEDWDLVNGTREEIFSKELPNVTEREVKEYVFN